MALSIAGLLVLVRLLGPGPYGVFAAAMVLVGLTDMLVGGHAAEAIVQREALERGHENAAFALLAATATVAAALVVLAAPLVSAWFGMDPLARLIPALAVLPILSAAAAVPTQLLVRRLRFDQLAKLQTAAGAAALAAGVGLAIAGAGVWSLAAMEIVRRLAALVLITIAARWRPGLRFGRGHFGEIARFALGRIVNFGLNYIAVTAVPRTVIAQGLGAEALGMFTVARRLIDQLNSILSGPISAVSFPAVSRLQREPEKLRRLITAAIRVTTWSYWPAVLGAFVIAPVLLPVALGPGWAGSVAVFQALTLAALRAPVSGFNSTVLAGMGRLGAITRIYLVSVVLAVAACLIGLRFGLVGVAAGLAVKQWLLWPFGAVAVWRATGYEPLRQIQVLARAAIPAATMMLLLLVLRAALPAGLSEAAVLGLLIGLGVAVYAIAWRLAEGDAAAGLVVALKAYRAGDGAAARAALARVGGG